MAAIDVPKDDSLSLRACIAAVGGVAAVAFVCALIVHSNCVNVPPPFTEPERTLADYCSAADRGHPWILTILPTALLTAAVMARRRLSWVRVVCGIALVAIIANVVVQSSLPYGNTI